ncbi:hypothetical protein TeGR_g2662 [Tetraparma gracilis]|uniref:Integral membrane protein DUF92-domain-containing protein n=1 Tax=Tetraparma gracilis TaxID=2962635 RepID=A0ABQ6MLN4_9STRA|nr:hypothetical protein TeGR_g2662 [Tetraparma gracilis]
MKFVLVLLLAALSLPSCTPFRAPPPAILLRPPPSLSPPPLSSFFPDTTVPHLLSSSLSSAPPPATLSAAFLLLSPPLLRSLTPAGLLAAYLLSLSLLSLSPAALLLGVFYFAAGVAATRLGWARKAARGIQESKERGGRRGPENVLGSGGVAVLLCGLARLLPARKYLLTLGVAASFATKLGDTCASEIGKAYGSTTFLITTLARVPRGTEGAVSLEGTLGGVAGSAAMTYLAFSLGLVSSRAHLALVLAAAVAAQFAESYIGARWQRGWLTNELVNFIMCAIGAAITVGGALLL